MSYVICPAQSRSCIYNKILFFDDNA